MSKLISVLLAVSLSFLLFVGMTFLIKPKAMEFVQDESREAIVISFNDKRKAPEIRKYPLPKEPEELKEPKPVDTVIETDLEDSRVAVLDIDFPRRFNDDLSKGLKLATLMNTGSGNGPAPRVRIDPRYPRDAAINEIEGFATLSFDISEIGTTENIILVDEKPRGVFYKEAKRALRKWHYSPKIVDGKAVSQPNQIVTLQFRFESELL